MQSIADHRRFLVEYVVRQAGLADDRLIAACAAVPREDYLGPGPWQVFVGSRMVLPPTADEGTGVMLLVTRTAARTYVT